MTENQVATALIAAAPFLTVAAAFGLLRALAWALRIDR